MVKSTISKSLSDILLAYKEAQDTQNALKKEREEILKGIFEKNPNEKVVSLTVRGEGIAFVVQKQESSTTSWGKLAKENLPNAMDLKPKYTSTYEKFLVQF